jgi:molybdopterin-binding protein
MNKLSGIITQIQSSGAIMLIDVDVDGHAFSALLIGSAINPKWLHLGNTIGLVFKETEVSLAKGLSGKISMRNHMMCRVMHIERGKLLSNITLQFQRYAIRSAITTRAIDALGVTVGEEIEALVKANEVVLMQ